MLEAIYPTISPRDYFAGLAMQALLAQGDKSVDLTTLARKSVECADAVLDALENPPRELGRKERHHG